MQTPFTFPRVLTPHYGYGSAYPASHGHPQAQSEGQSSDNAAAEEYTPATHLVNGPVFGAYPLFPVFHPVPAYVPHGAFTPHAHSFPTYHNSPFRHTGDPVYSNPTSLPPADPRFAPFRTTQRPLSGPQHDRHPVHRDASLTRQFTSSQRPTSNHYENFNGMGQPDRDEPRSSDPSEPRPFAPPPTPVTPSTFPATPFSRPLLSTPTGRYGITNLLNFQLDSYPFIDWVICQDLSFARQWVPARSGGGRCQSVDFNGNAVVPPVHRLRICPKERRSLLGQAMRRWGEVEVRRFDHFINIGDVLHAIWDYFQQVLTYADRENIVAESMDFANRVAESYRRRCNGRDSHRRCDTLLGRLRFAGLEIDFDFERTRILYLSLENMEQ